MAIPHKFLLLFLLAALLPPKTNAQITVRSASDVETSPNLLVREDSIYVVRDQIIEGGDQVILESLSQSTTYYYEWTRYNASTNTWTIPVATGDIASYPVSTAGGYQLTIREGMNGSVLEQHRCWVFNSPLAEAAIEVVNENCDFLELRAITDSTLYYGPDGRYALVDYGLTYHWSASTGEGDFQKHSKPVHRCPGRRYRFHGNHYRPVW